MGATYEGAGVSISRNDEAVDLIRKRVVEAGATRAEVIDGIGGFAGAFAASFAGLTDPVLVSASDGVGTKLSIAQTLDKHDTVGYDLVAMVVDDIVCTGAEPLFLLDYLACGYNDPVRTAEIVGGIADACASCNVALLGGETAEHPGTMAADEYDLAAFGVGVVDRSAMLGAARVQEGDAVIGLASSGLHSNGYSLVRKLILDHDLSLDATVPGGRSFGDELLEPCTIYAPAILNAIQSAEVHAAAHITGGGIAYNVERALPYELGARIDGSAWKRPAIFDFLQQAGSIGDDEMLRVFNCGLGMVVVVEAVDVDAALRALGPGAAQVGEIVAGAGVAIT